MLSRVQSRPKYLAPPTGILSSPVRGGTPTATPGSSGPTAAVLAVGAADADSEDGIGRARRGGDPPRRLDPIDGGGARLAATATSSGSDLEIQQKDFEIFKAWSFLEDTLAHAFPD